jgi:hypothetical protein
MKPKKFTEDLFYWLRALQALFVVWRKAVLACRQLQLCSRIIEVIVTTQMEREVWSTASIGRDIEEINRTTEELRNCSSLHQIIRAKMNEYFEVTSDILNI